MDFRNGGVNGIGTPMFQLFAPSSYLLISLDGGGCGSVGRGSLGWG